MLERFLKECRITARNILFLVFCLVLAGMYFSQYREDVNYDLTQAQKGILFEASRWGDTQNNLLVKPTPDMESYGFEDAEVPEQVRRNMTYRLYRDISNNRYDTYRLGMFLTHKSLKFQDRQRMLSVFERIAGESYYQLDARIYRMDLDKILEAGDRNEKQAMNYLRTDYYKQLRNEFVPDHAVISLYDYEKYMPINEELTYDGFKKEIGEIRKIIGGRPAAYENFEQYGSDPLTYEEALSKYETMIYEDKVSGAYARLFCDYMGIAAGIWPAIIAWAVTSGGLWRKKSVRPDYSLYYSDSGNLWIRFSSISTLSYLPIAVLAVIATAELSAGVRPLGLSVDYFAFLGYSFVWLLPTVMFAAAVGLFFTHLTKKPIGIFIQFIIWLWSVMPWSDSGLVSVKYGANLFLRHSVVGEYETYAASMGEILINRAVYTIAALILMAVLSAILKYRGSRE